MSFNGPALSFDDEGSILFDGEKIIVHVPVGHELLGHIGSDDNIPFPVVYTHPSHQENQQASTEQTTGQASDSDSGGQGSTGSPKTEISPTSSDANGETDAQAVLQDIGNAQQSPIDSADIKFYLAAPHNSVLNEVRLMCQYESIPPAWRDRPDLFLWLCAEYGIDEENDAEARDYLDHIANGGSNHQNTDDPLHVAWKAAHESYNPEVKDEATEVTNYRVQIKSTYGVELTSLDGAEDWDLLRVRMVHVGLEMAAAALGEMARQMGLDWGDITAFRRIIGYIELRLTKEPHGEDAYAGVYGRIITFYSNGYPYPDLLLHELGHVFNTHAGLGNEDGAGSINMTKPRPDTREGLGKADPEKLRLFDVLGLTENDKLISGCA